MQVASPSMDQEEPDGGDGGLLGDIGRHRL
jgi:hypothetical protein